MSNQPSLKKLNQNWWRANLANDFIFAKVVQDEEIAIEVLHRILPGLKISKVAHANAQQEFGFSPDAKSIRLDIYVEDDQHRKFDIEMQTANHYNLPQRIRFYQSNLAMNSYEKGQNFKLANDAYVVFFCCFDPFGLGQQKYVIQRRIVGQTDYQYQDGETILLFDVTASQHEVNPQLQNLLDTIAGKDIECNDPFIVKLKQRISLVKHNRKWRFEFMLRSLYEMDIENDMIRAKKEGLQEGLQKGLQTGSSQERIHGIRVMADTLRGLDVPEQKIITTLMEQYHLSHQEAVRHLGH